MKKFAVIAALAFALTGCGTHLAPTTAAMQQAADADALAKKKTDTKAGARKAPPQVKAPKGQPRQGLAASQAAQNAASTLATYQNLTYQWQNAYSDFDRDNIETQMLQVLHQGLNNVQQITSAQGVDTSDRRSYDIADRALDQYDRGYSQWQGTWDVTQKRYILNGMMTDMVSALQQIQANYY